MNNNLFEGAKFGGLFVTRDGRKAIYVAKHTEHSCYDESVVTKVEHAYVLENRCCVHWCDDNGKNQYGVEEFDLVGRWGDTVKDGVGLFSGAKFGDIYLTDEGREMRFVKFDADDTVLMLTDKDNLVSVLLDGRHNYWSDGKYIVGKKPQPTNQSDQR